MISLEKAGQNNPLSDKEYLDSANFHLAKFAQEQLGKLDLSSKELVAWFDLKYGQYGDVTIPLRGQGGQLVPDGERNYKDISSEEKISHGLGVLRLLTKDSLFALLDYLSNQQPELLEIADKGGHFVDGHSLRDTVNKYLANKKKLEEL